MKVKVKNKHKGTHTACSDNQSGTVTFASIQREQPTSKQLVYSPDWTTGLTQTAIKCLFRCRTEAHSACYYPEVAPLA